MKKPLIRPITYSDESPIGLLLRASELNGWKSPNAFISAYKVHSSVNTYSFLSVITNKKHWGTTCRVFGITNKVECYERMKVSRGSIYDFHGMQVPYRSLRMKEPSICPDCINNKRYLPCIWDHKLITACTTHNTKLVKTCPKCKEKIKWSRKGLSICSCDHKFISLKSRCINTEVTQYIEGVINKKDGFTLDLIFHFFEAFELFFNNINISVDQHQLATLAGECLIDKQKVISLLCKHVTKVALSLGLHPRLTLFPFLRSSESAINELSTAVLNKLSESKVKLGKMPNTVNFRFNILSAEKTLGVSTFLLKELISHSIIDVKQDNKNSLIEVTISSVNNLLILFSGTTKSSELHKSIASLTSKTIGKKITLVSIIEKIETNKTTFSGMDISSGILSAKVCIKSFEGKGYDALTLIDVAKICGVHSESIRLAVRCGILERIDPVKTKGTNIYIEEKVALNFNKKYIFAGKIAKENNCSQSTIALKLIASGITPASGPKIDNGLTYIFKKSDISTLNMNEVIRIENYPTNAGRKKKAQKKEVTDEQGIPLYTVAHQLGISIPKTASLIKKGFLKEAGNKARKKMITNESFERVKNIQQDPSLVTLKQASKYFHEDEKAFLRRWVNSQFISLIDNGLNRYVSKKDLTKIKNHKKKYVTSKEAGIITNTHRTHMLNLEKQNLIKPAKYLISGKQKINFYNRKQVLEVCK
ncbi:MAG: TniQ family protein [Cellulophaga sp.]